MLSKIIITSKKPSQSSYVIGFMISLILTLAAYSLVVSKVFSGYGLGLAIAALAILQLTVQLRLFLHLGKEPEPRWNLLVFDFMLLVVAILVFGSLWIMFSLDYHHSDSISPEKTDEYIFEEEGIKR